MVEPAGPVWGGPVPDDAGFREWMLVRASALRRKAFLLCGDWSAADDLVQDVLVAMYPRWSRIVRGGHVDAYANRVLVGKHPDDPNKLKSAPVPPEIVEKFMRG